MSATPPDLRLISGGARPCDPCTIARAVALIAGCREGHPPEHAARVAELAVAIATVLGLDDDAIERCVIAGWLHDIGMVALPDSVLAPPDPLGVADCAVTRMHAAIGADLVARVTELAAAAPAIRHHHERFDGGGYPGGLGGDAIPIESRIVAAADALAALLPHDRPDPRTRKVAASRLRDLAGRELDPAIVDAAIAVLAAEATRAGEYLPRTA